MTLHNVISQGLAHVEVIQPWVGNSQLSGVLFFSFICNLNLVRVVGHSALGDLRSWSLVPPAAEPGGPVVRGAAARDLQLPPSSGAA